MKSASVTKWTQGGFRIMSRIATSILGAGLALAVTAGTAAADFRGGGALVEMTEACSQHGWPVGRALEVVVRHRPVEMNGPDVPFSQITMYFNDYTEHLAVWQTFASTTLSYDALGRGVGTWFGIHPLWPRVRPVQRRIISRVDPLGPETVQNAREMVLRLRISNFNSLQGCAATLVATVVRF